ncbi:hypothetical protein THASP1DRAFT_32560, partial [Thamnocephalis sphaerospora]
MLPSLLDWPQEIVQRICLYMPPMSVHRLSLVCKQLRKTAVDDERWQQRYWNDFSRRRSEQDTARFLFQRYPGANWLEVYLRRRRLEKSWWRRVLRIRGLADEVAPHRRNLAQLDRSRPLEMMEPRELVPYMNKGLAILDDELLLCPETGRRGNTLVRLSLPIKVAAIQLVAQNHRYIAAVVATKDEHKRVLCLWDAQTVALLKMLELDDRQCGGCLLLNAETM